LCTSGASWLIKNHLKLPTGLTFYRVIKTSKAHDSLRALHDMIKERIKEINFILAHKPLCQVITPGLKSGGHNCTLNQLDNGQRVREKMQRILKLLKIMRTKTSQIKKRLNGLTTIHFVQNYFVKLTTTTRNKVLGICFLSEHNHAHITYVHLTCQHLKSKHL